MSVTVLPWILLYCIGISHGKNLQVQYLKKKKVKNFKFRFEFFKNTQNINRIYFSTSIITEIGKTSTVQNKESNAVLIILKEGCILAIFTLVKIFRNCVTPEVPIKIKIQSKNEISRYNTLCSWSISMYIFCNWDRRKQEKSCGNSLLHYPL